MSPATLIMLPVHWKPRKEKESGSLEKKLHSVTMFGEGDGAVPAAFGTRGNWDLPRPDIEVWYIPQCSHQMPQEQLGPHTGPQLSLPSRRPLGPLYLGLLV